MGIALGNPAIPADCPEPCFRKILKRSGMRVLPQCAKIPATDDLGHTPAAARRESIARTGQEFSACDDLPGRNKLCRFVCPASPPFLTPVCPGSHSPVDHCMAGKPRNSIGSHLRMRTTCPRIFLALLVISGTGGCAQEFLRSSGQVPWRNAATERQPLRVISADDTRQESPPEVSYATGKQEIGGWSGPETVTRLTGIVLPVLRPRQESRREILPGPQIAPRRPTERRSQPRAGGDHDITVIPGPAERRPDVARSKMDTEPTDNRLNPPEERIPATGATKLMADEPISDVPDRATAPRSDVWNADPWPPKADTQQTAFGRPGDTREIPELNTGEPDSGEDAPAESSDPPGPGRDSPGPGRDLPAPGRDLPAPGRQNGAPEGSLPPASDDSLPPSAEQALLPAADPTAAAPTAEPTADPAGGATLPREPSMLNRIREFYTPRVDENPGELLRKQFRRLQTPWGLRRERLPVPPEIGTQSESESESEIGSTNVAAGTNPELSAAAADDPQPPPLQPLIESLQRELKDWPRDESGLVADVDLWRQRQTDLRLLQLVAGQAAEAMRVIEGLPEEEQEFWQSLMLSLTYYRGTQHDHLSRENQLLATSEELRAAVRHIQALSPLRIRRMEFCSAINGFASVEAFPSADFSTGQPVLVYAEVENFRSQLTERGTYHTEFSAVLEILREDQLVESIPIDVIADEAGTRRTDFFLSFDDLTIPAHLNPGQYSVRLKLRDQLSRQQTDAKLPFNVR